MTFYFKDVQPTVVHIDTDVIRASIGLGELFVRPTTTIKACYAAPKAGSSSKLPPADEVKEGETDGAENGDDSSRTGWVAGDEMDAALSSDFEEKLEVRWPFREGSSDWDGREFVLSHLFSLLGIKISANTSPLLLIPPSTPSSLPLSEQILYTQLAFEKLNVPGLSILPVPLAALFALGSTTGITLHTSHTTTEINVILDSIVKWECSVTVPLGIQDCQEHFEKLLMADEGLDKELRMAKGMGDSASGFEFEDGEKTKLVKEVANFVWTECTGDDIEIPAAKIASKAFVVNSKPATEEDDGTIDIAKKLVNDAAPVPAPASHKSKKQQQQAATAAANAAAAAEAAALADFIAITIPSFPEKEISLGPVRHRICEPLLLGKERGGDTIWEGMGRAVESAGLAFWERSAVWEAVGVVGEIARIKSFPTALMTYLAPFLLSSPDLPSESQPARVRLLSIPDYFSNFRNATSELAPFLGGQMVAKMAFSDSGSRYCITKVDYNSKGPAAIHIVGAEER